MANNKYTNEKNILMLISILKENGIRKVVASPGSTNISFVASLQNDDFFEVYSCVDERSACYMACGMSIESGEPVVLTCTGATASRNYMSGLTEAYYRKIPILAVTATQHFSRIGQYSPQCLDRSIQPNDIVNLSVQIPSIQGSSDEIGCNLLLNKAVQELKRDGGGPIHINIETKYESTKGFSESELPVTKIIKRYGYNDIFPSLDDKKTVIFVGSHNPWPNELEKAVGEFCEKYNSYVVCDQTSNYFGKYKIQANLLFDQDKYTSPNNDYDVVIHIGYVSGAYININTKESWRVNEDGEFRDTFSRLKNVFQVSELDFFNFYNKHKKGHTNTDRFNDIKAELDEIVYKYNNLDLPLSNIWVQKQLSKYIPDGSTVHLAILNSLRSANYNVANKKVYYYSNTGGFGIDGPLSTLIGASMINKNKNYYGVVGDLAFFYDLNSLGNRHVGNNLRIILINNGGGMEFHNYSHPASLLGEMTGKYISADGHFGNKSDRLVKNYAEDLGFEYISASSKEEVIEKIEYFTAEKLYDKPILFEIFTSQSDESDALKITKNINYSIKGNIINKAKSILSAEQKAKIKKIIKM